MKKYLFLLTIFILILNSSMVVGQSVEPLKVSDPGYPLCDCNPGYENFDEFISPMNPTFVIITDPLSDGKKYICANKGLGYALYYFRKWSCIGKDENCYLSYWENGHPTFKEYPLKRTLIDNTGKTSFTITKPRGSYIYRDLEDVEESEYHDLKLMDRYMHYSESSELRLVEHLAIAIKYYKQELIRNLIHNDGKGINTKDKYGWSSLMYASRIGLLDIVKLLIENGADVERDSEALIWASKFEFILIADVLVNNGASLEYKDSGGFTAMDWAKKNNHPYVFSILEKNGAKSVDGITSLHIKAKDTYLIDKDDIAYFDNVDVRDNYGRTPLMYAADFCNFSVCDDLLELGANINAQDNKGFTALMYAVLSNNNHVAKKYFIEDLIDFNVDAKMKNNDGMTALDLALKGKNKKTIKLIKQAERKSPD